MERLIKECQAPEVPVEGLAKETIGSDSYLHSDDLTTAAGTLPALLDFPHKHLQHEGLDITNGEMQLSAQDSGYTSSESSTQQAHTEALGGSLEDAEPQRRSRASSHTSISSIPGSVLTHLPDRLSSVSNHEVNEYMFQPWGHHDCNGQNTRQVHTVRQREAMFRKPSSVRAMQMHTEDEGDDEYLTPPKRRGGQRISDVSMRSAGASPLKRSPYYLPTAVSKPKIKKEYPLVLLHCTLLPPSLPIPGLIGQPDQKILKEVLPPLYWRRWRLLEEKTGSGVIRDRGVLISHPEDMYDLLEERLLESLELQRPRLDRGHFLGQDEVESDREDQLIREDSGTEEDEEKCPDCGIRVARHNMPRKWEIKVFAANGLMRAGAWAAAWKEMEKVDVEVGLWLPSDVRAELERRLTEERVSQTNHSLQIPLLQKPEDNSLTAAFRAQTLTLPDDEPSLCGTQQIERSPSPRPITAKTEDTQPSETFVSQSTEEIDLQTLLVNYIRVLASDRRNVAIAFLSVLVLFCAIHTKSKTSVSDLQPFPQEMLEYTSSSSSFIPEQEQQHSSETRVDSTSVKASDSIGIITSTPLPSTISESMKASDSMDLTSTQLVDVMLEPVKASDTMDIIVSTPLHEIVPDQVSQSRSSTFEPSAVESESPSLLGSETSFAEISHSSPTLEELLSPTPSSEALFRNEDMMMD